MSGDLRKIIDHYGVENQMGVAVGEIGELITEFGRRAQGRDSKEKWIDEIADAKVMIGQMIIMLDLDPEAIEKRVDFKINRQLDRIAEEKNGF